MRLPFLSQLFGRRQTRPAGRDVFQRRFDATSGQRGNPTFGSYGPETLAGSAIIARRARYAAENNAWLASGVAALATALVGAGIVPTPQHSERETRRALQAAFNRWAVVCDLDGRTDFYGLIAGLARSMVVSGEGFLQFVLTDEGLRLRLIAPEQVDIAQTGELTTGGRIVAGVEFDSIGRRVAYWIRPVDPTAIFEGYAPPVRVPAADVLHLFRPLGPGQVRGVSFLAPVLIRAGELDQLDDALLVGAKIAAMYAGFLTDQNGSSTGFPFEGVEINSVMETGLEPGTLKVLPAGFDIKFSGPQNAQQSVDFAKLQLRGIAAGLGVPEYLLTGDLTGANYSSLRAGLLEFRRRVETIQFHTIIPQVLRPIWQRFVTTAVLTRDLDAPDFEANADEYFACEWIPPAQEWIDPTKDAEATATMIASGLTSRRRAVAAQGYSVEELDSEIASDREREKELGLSFPAREAADAPA